MEKIAYVKRLRKIFHTLANYGFGQLIQNTGIKELARYLPFPLKRKEKKGIKELSPAVRLRLVLEELGPTFIKFGQLLSTRADLLPSDYIQELRRLQDQVTSFSFSQVKEVIEKELKYPLHLLFESFEEAPLAAASIGQVHRAVLPGKKEIAVKVQRPDIKKIIEVDLAILEEIALLLDKYTLTGKLYHFAAIVREFKQTIHMELNFYQEGRNAERFKKNFISEKNIYIPSIYWNYTTPKILTMEYMDGVMLNNPEELGKEGFSKRKLVENLSKAFLKQILIDGFFHGDPHPGNIGVLAGEKLYFLDFGITGFLHEEQRQALSELMLGVIYHDMDRIMHALQSLAIISEETDKKLLKLELERLQEKYYNIPLQNLHFGQVMYELMEISFKQQIILSPEFTLLAKTFITLEGLITDLEPNFSIAEIIAPFSKEFLRQKFSRKKIASTVYQHLGKYFRLVEILPQHLSTILEKGAAGNVKIKVEFVNTERILHHLNNMINRISFSIVLASIIVGLCLALQFAEVTLFRYFPIAQFGLILAALMGFWWLWSILRSGKL
ncbi:MAG: ABC1 kinase family protein [Dethiobacteria bacterium]